MVGKLSREPCTSRTFGLRCSSGSQYAPHRLYGSLGAVTIIVALLLSPFAQQVVIYRTLPQESEAGATNYRAMNFTVALPSVDSAVPFVPVLPIKSAVYNGLFAENNKPWTSLPVNCETGNCTWEPFDTLAVCNSCTDMTPFLQRDCATGDEDCGWRLMSGPVLESGDVFSMTSQVSHPQAENFNPKSGRRLNFCGSFCQRRAGHHGQLS